MDKQVIGSCSICGGNVVAYVGAWHSVLPPPPPTCSHCGAVDARSTLPVIPMVPKQHRVYTNTGPWQRQNINDNPLLDFYRRFGTYSGCPQEDDYCIEDCYG